MERENDKFLAAEQETKCGSIIYLDVFICQMGKKLVWLNLKYFLKVIDKVFIMSYFKLVGI